MLHKIVNLLRLATPYSVIENAAMKASGLNEIMEKTNYWDRIAMIYDRVDQAINGTVHWKGGSVANPHGKRFSATLVMLAIIAIARDKRLDTVMRANTQYDPKNLPPE